MRIAICDDEKKELETIMNHLNEYKLKNRTNFVYSIFDNPLDLIGEIRNNARYDILFLDILFPNLNGIEVAKEIRTYDESVNIIFISSSPEFAIDSYTVNAYYYTTKPLSLDDFTKILDRLITKIQHQKKEFRIVKSNANLIRVDFNSLEYCEVINKTIYYHLNDQTIINSSESMSELADSLLNYSQFIKPHRSYIVNMQFIKKVTSKTIEMESGCIIPIPHGKSRSVKQSFLDFSIESMKDTYK